MKRCISSAVLILFACSVASAESVPAEKAPAGEPTVVRVDAGRKNATLDPMIYGQFIEHMGRCINGGIWAEMLEDRKFFYDVGSEDSPWKIGEGKIVPSRDKPFSGKQSARIVLENDTTRGSMSQVGLAFRENRAYIGYVWLKCEGNVKHVGLVFEVDRGHAAGTLPPITIPVRKGDFYRHEFRFTAPSDGDGRLTVSAFGVAHEKGSATIGCLSLMPADNVHGMRADTLECLKRLDAPIYRWPGGNFVSGYDWKDGIGDRDRRPTRKNPAWKGIEPNDFGIDEFLLFCRLLKTEPYIAVNTGNGDVDGAIEQLEYVNGAASTPMGKLRSAHGHPEPYGVVWWGIGNEMYGKWQIGHMPVDEYVKKHNAFVDAFRAKDPNVKVIAVGNAGKWDEAFLPGAAGHMDMISEHFYLNGIENVTDHVRQIPDKIRRIAEVHRKYRKELPGFKDLDKPVPIALDEWNYWRNDRTFGLGGTRFYVKDGLGVAAGIHELARQSEMYGMANYAQTVNVIGCIKTTGTNAKLETTGLALELYRRHFENIPVATTCDDKTLDVQAALSEDGSRLSLGIVNTTEKSETLRLEIAGFDAAGKIRTGFEIADPQNDPMGFNDPDKPYRIEIVKIKEDRSAGNVVVKPYSITLLKFESPKNETSRTTLRRGMSSGKVFRSGFPRMIRPGRF